MILHYPSTHKHSVHFGEFIPYMNIPIKSNSDSTTQYACHVQYILGVSRFWTKFEATCIFSYFQILFLYMLRTYLQTQSPLFGTNLEQRGNGYQQHVYRCANNDGNSSVAQFPITQFRFQIDLGENQKIRQIDHQIKMSQSR